MSSWLKTHSKGLYADNSWINNRTGDISYSNPNLYAQSSSPAPSHLRIPTGLRNSVISTLSSPIRINKKEAPKVPPVKTHSSWKETMDRKNNAARKIQSCFRAYQLHKMAKWEARIREEERQRQRVLHNQPMAEAEVVTYSVKKQSPISLSTDFQFNGAEASVDEFQGDE